MDEVRAKCGNDENMGRLYKQALDLLTPRAKFTTLKSTFKAIDDEIQYKLHLLDYEIFKEWVYVKALFVEPVSESHLKRLTILLIEQYNQIINEYSKVVGKGLQKIPSDLLLQNTDKDNI